MEPRFAVRNEQLLTDCQVPPSPFSGILGRLESFGQPFISSLASPESCRCNHRYLGGLLSDLGMKNAGAIAASAGVQRQWCGRFVIPNGECRDRSCLEQCAASRCGGAS